PPTFSQGGREFTTYHDSRLELPALLKAALATVEKFFMVPNAPWPSRLAQTWSELCRHRLMPLGRTKPKAVIPSVLRFCSPLASCPSSPTPQLQGVFEQRAPAAWIQ